MQAPRVFHLNCGTLRPLGLFPFSTLPLYNTGKLFGKGLAVIHCLLVDSGEGLILVDTGYGRHDYTEPARMVRLYSKVTNLEGNIHQSAVHQIRALGYEPSDVKHIFLTHMHLDHSGGLPDFPSAQVHVYEKEFEAALHKRGLAGLPYIQQHWAHHPEWVIHKLQGETWHGLERTQIFTIGQVKAFLLPMLGHSPGNSAVVIRLPHGRYYLHAGDIYGYHGMVDPGGPFAPRFQWLFRPLFRLYPLTRAMYQYDHHFRHIQRELADQLVVFSSHDPYHFKRLAGE
jgi:glyoxylase-like metal-dependent hydrolase (beta-lactamase superfamily II)